MSQSLEQLTEMGTMGGGGGGAGVRVTQKMINTQRSQ